MNRILVIPQRLVWSLDLPVWHAIVSIRDPGDVFAIPHRWGRRGVLPLYFTDLEKFSGPEDVALLKGMTPEHARQAWEFVNLHAPNIDTLVIHCFAGKCRSVGMGHAIGDVLGVPVEVHCSEPAPNRHVYRLMRRHWDESTQE